MNISAEESIAVFAYCPLALRAGQKANAENVKINIKSTMHMKLTLKTLLLLAFFGCVSTAGAQDQDVKNLLRDAYHENDSLQGVIRSLQAEAKNAAADTAAFAKQIAQAEKERDKANVRADKAEKELADFKGRFAKVVDEKIYKQCLLYPLTRRYNDEYCNEALEAVKILKDEEIELSDNFNKMYKTYEPLVRKYGKYNDELIRFVDDPVLKRHNLLKGKPATADQIANMKQLLRQTSYYRECYVKRSSYISIPYLDEAVEKLEKGMGSKSEVEAVRKMLEPKKKANSEANPETETNSQQ